MTRSHEHRDNIQSRFKNADKVLRNHADVITRINDILQKQNESNSKILEISKKYVALIKDKVKLKNEDSELKNVERFYQFYQRLNRNPDISNDIRNDRQKSLGGMKCRLLKTSVSHISKESLLGHGDKNDLLLSSVYQPQPQPLDMMKHNAVKIKSAIENFFRKVLHMEKKTTNPRS